MADAHKYQAHEVLNRVLNSAETAIQVDIISGSEYAEDAAHTTADVGTFVLAVRNDTLAYLGADGDYVPFQVNADGALYVEVAASSLDGSVYVDDANWTDSTSKHTLVGGLYQSTPQSITDGDTGPLQVNANGNLIVDLSATDNAVLDAMVVDLAAIEALLITIDSDTDAIKTAVQIIDDWDDSNYANVNANIAGTDIVGGAGAVASGVQRMTLASDDPAVANLNEMLDGTALAVTAVDGGSDHTLGATYQAFFIGVGGDVSLDMATSGTNIVFKNLASGQMLPVQATVVNATNTTATNIVALKA